MVALQVLAMATVMAISVIVEAVKVGIFLFSSQEI